MRKEFLTFWLLYCLIGSTILSASAQEPAASKTEVSPARFRLIFYNLENAFDTIDDPYAGDDEFLPTGPRGWTPYRYWKKIRGLYKVIVATGGWELPDLIGVCEVEHKRVLTDLIHHTPLSKQPYRILHKDSPDPRGMDVAALYHPGRFEMVSHRFIPIPIEGKSSSTRDILYIKGLVKQRDTLHVFFNHWPSKWQGALKTQAKRNQAAATLRKQIDSIYSSEPNARIVAAGDFNDPPGAPCLTQHLKALKPEGTHNEQRLYNLSFRWKSFPMGTQKYRARWQLLDQIIVSGNLLLPGDEFNDSSGNPKPALYTSPEWARIFAPAFLLTEDLHYTGSKPFRTYTGYKYSGGFSDHLPVILDLHMQ